MRTKELPAIEYPSNYSNDNPSYFQTEEMADNTNKQVRTVNIIEVHSKFVVRFHYISARAESLNGGRIVIFDIGSGKNC